MNFLQLIHPYLKEENFHEVCVELRPLPRSGRKFLMSASIWQARRSLDDLEKFLAMINGKPTDAYFSVYSMDRELVTYKSNGEKYKKGKINGQNAMFTQIIPMDFDDINEDEYEKYIQRLAALGIEVILVFSGHGFQSHILLDQPCPDKSLLMNMTTLLRKKGFPVDEAISDPARVMRLPFTNNCKAFDQKNKCHSDNPVAIPTDLIATTERRYSLDTVIEILQSLPDDPILPKQEKPKKIEVKAKKKVEEPKKSQTQGENQYKRADPESEYQGIITWINLPIHVQLMLSRTREGLRNQVLMYLIPYLRNSLKLNLDQIKEVMGKWATRCIPAQEVDFVWAEVERIFAYGAKGLSGRYTEEMEKEFGHQMKTDKFLRLNKVAVQNQFFESFPELSDTAVKIYFAMKVEEGIREKVYWTIDEICVAANISKNSVRRNIADLIQNKFVDKKRSDRKTGNKYQYFLNQFPSQHKGYTLFERGTLRAILFSLTGGELKLYTYITCMIGASPNRECYASQAYLAEHIGKKQCSISQMTGSLHDKRYIRKITRVNGYISHCEYILNF